MPTRKQKTEMVAGGTAVAAAPFTPTRVTMPKSPGNRRAGRTAATTGKSSVADLRDAYRGMGGRLGNDSHTARLAQSMKEKVREDRPIELKRFRSGETMMVGGHHRVAAAEMIGLKELPTHVTDSHAKHPYSVVPLYARGKYKRDVKAARTPGRQMSDEEIARVAAKKTPHIHQSVNSAKSRVEESITALKKPKVGIPVAIGAATAGAGLAVKNKDKIIKREATNAELARAKRQQANLSTTSAVLGATALGTKGAAYAYHRKARMPKGYAHPPEIHATAPKTVKALSRAHKLDKVSLGILTGAAGVGSISGLRFAHVQREEAKKIEKGLPRALPDSDTPYAAGRYLAHMMGKDAARHKASGGAYTDKIINQGKRFRNNSRKNMAMPPVPFGKSEKGLVMTNAFGISHEYVLIEKGKHSPPNETTPLKDAAQKSNVTLKAVGSKAKTFGAGHPYLTTAAIGAGIGGAVLAPGILASESASRRRMKRAFGKARGFDPEDRRERRQKVYGAALLGGAGAAGASTVKPAKKAAKVVSRSYDKGGVKRVLRLKTLESKPVQQALKRGGVAGAALLGAGAVASQARNSGRRYSGWYS